MYHPPPYDVQNSYWAYGPYPAGAPLFEYHPYPIYSPTVINPALVPFSKAQAPIDPNFTQNPTTSTFVNTSQSNNDPYLEETSSTRPSSKSPSLASTSESQMAAATSNSSQKPRCTIRVVDPETKEDLTEKLAEMCAQVAEEERAKQPPVQTQQTPHNIPANMAPPPPQNHLDLETLRAHQLPQIDPHAIVPVMPYQMPPPPYEQRRGPNSRNYTGPRRGGGHYNRSYQPPPGKQQRNPRQNKPLHPREQEIRVNRVPPQVQATRAELQQQHEEDDLMYKASQLQSSEPPVSGNCANTSTSTPSLVEPQAASEVSESPSMTTSEGLQSEDCNSPQKVLPEVTCILNNNLEIVQLVSDAQVRIEEVNDLKSACSTSDISSEVVSSKAQQQKRPTTVTATAHLASPVGVTSQLAESKPKDANNRESASSSNKPQSSNGASTTILPKTATWGNKFSKAAIVKPINVIPPMQDHKESKKLDETKGETEKKSPVSSLDPVHFPSANSPVTKQDTIKPTEKGSTCGEKEQAKVQSVVSAPLTSWSSRLAASVANVQPIQPRPVPVAVSPLAQPQPTLIPQNVPGNNTESTYQDSRSQYPTKKDADNVQKMGTSISAEKLVEPKPKAKASPAMSLESNNSKSELSEADVDQEGFQEVKQKRKQKPTPQPTPNAWGGASRRAPPSYSQTSNFGASQSAVPSHENSDNRPQSIVARSSSFDRPEDKTGNSGSGFRGRSFGRPPPRLPRGSGWGRRDAAPRAPVGPNADVGGTKPAEDTEVVIMKSLQFENNSEKSGSSASTSNEGSTSSCWADQVEAQKPSSGGSGSSSWSQVVRTTRNSSTAGAASIVKTNLSHLPPTKNTDKLRQSSQEQDVRPEWARVEPKVTQPTAPSKVIGSWADESQKHEIKPVPAKERSVSPIGRGVDIVSRGSFSKVSDSSNVSVTENSHQVSAAQPVKPVQAQQSSTPQSARNVSPKRRERDHSPPQFSALVSHSDKRTLPAFRRGGGGGQKERSSRSPSPLAANIGGQQTGTSSSISSVFGSDKGNPPKQRQMAVVNPMKFDD